MTREEIDTAWSRALGEAAKEAGAFADAEYHRLWESGGSASWSKIRDERFAAIIRAQALEEAKQACLKRVDEFPLSCGSSDYDYEAIFCADAIESLKGQP